MIVSNPLIKLLRTEFLLDWGGIHGAPHWARVRKNGLRLCELTGANVRVVEAFAFLHDSQRRNDDHDPDHGRRAAQFAKSLPASQLELSDEELELLVVACEGYSEADHARTLR